MARRINVRLDDRGRSPQLPAFCRTRRPSTTTVRVSSLQQLFWLLWLVLALQLSTILLILAGPVPAPVRLKALPSASEEGVARVAAASMPLQKGRLPTGATKRLQATTPPSSSQP